MLGWRSALLLCWVCLLPACGSSGDHNPYPTRADGRLHPAVDYNLCPVFAYHMLLPHDVDPGDSADATVWVVDPDDEEAELRFAWSATSGIFSDPWLPETKYSCAASGLQGLTLQVRDPRGCERSLELEVNCLSP